MKNMLSICLGALLLLGTSCRQGANSQEGPTQMDRVMAVHDEVMPKMGQIGNLVAELKAKVDTTASGKQYGTAMEDLQGAHAAMMDWMTNFGERFDHGEITGNTELNAQKQEWLDQEEEKVQALKEQINGSIERAEALLVKGQ